MSFSGGSENLKSRGVDVPLSNDSGNSYGAHLLVDFSPIDAADKVLEDCESFIEDSKALASPVPETSFPILSKVGAGIRSWRSKRRDVKLGQSLDILLPRIIQSEKVLRNIIGEVVEKKAALRMQARYLQVRLEVCIAHNKKLLDKTNEPLVMLRSYVNKLSGESTTVKAMMAFNKEVLRIRNVEKVSKGQSFVRWGSKPQKAAVTEFDLAKDSDHPALDLRLVQLREVNYCIIYALTVMCICFSVDVLTHRGVCRCGCQWC
jgi:hypothetical protein